MSEIQIKLADINRRSAEAQAARDRQFWSIVAYVWIIAIAVIIAFYSIPRAVEASHQQFLANQENVRHG